MRIKLSKNFYLDEFTFSQTAIRHSIDVVVEPGSIHFERLLRFANTIAQPLRDAVGPIHVSSGYRPLELNRLVGSGDDSQHIECEAGDLIPEKVTVLQLCEAAIDLKLPYDQLIYEFSTWAHLSISKTSTPPRGDILSSYTFHPVVGKAFTKYVNGLFMEPAE